jgi:hypothetical protein
MYMYQQAIPSDEKQVATAEQSCIHCECVTDHEHWCITQNPEVRYAFTVAVYPNVLTLQDQLILHALGVTWNVK